MMGIFLTILLYMFLVGLTMAVIAAIIEAVDSGFVAAAFLILTPPVILLWIMTVRNTSAIVDRLSF